MGAEAPMSNSLSSVEEHIDSTRNKRLFMKEGRAKYFIACVLRKKNLTEQYSIQNVTVLKVTSPLCSIQYF